MKDIRQELFNHLSEDHDLILLETELDAIIDIVRDGLNNSAQSEALSVGNNEQANELMCSRDWVCKTIDEIDNCGDNCQCNISD